ncbi:hypothetical protein MARA_23590 [Mycolicibacterium arabiense]|uniref:Transport accessory protein MmpS3 n=1 Tax=Mycolicibacterium arabiense TaxID=1286181 RepID=A0A7I7RXH2_9MYCO|nr:hypothetical protein [Mycolicibacterium arabiense]MCV7373646.1 hypothetical protein [Mycolicibacterium arabiense]BBY48891.1 hypothetical protein MARA_23590 [Mycolicibacterium arabiense]
MSRENRPYSPYSGRSPRAESWRPDRTYGDYGRERRYGYDSGYGSTYESPYSSTYGGSDPRTQVLDADDRRGYDRYGNDRYGSDRYAPQDHDSDDVAPEYDDDEIYEYYEPLDRRWVWVGGVAGAILLVAVICTVVILGGGDSGSVSATVVPPTATSQAPATTSKAPPAASTPRVLPPVASLPPETVTTVTPSPSATVAPPPVAAAPPPAPAANTVTYSVTGTRPLIDLVTVIYTDAQGALKTDLNVSLPWNKTVVLDPGVTLSSVTATSVTGQLNCSIVDGAGATIALQNSNSMITTCTR